MQNYPNSLLQMQMQGFDVPNESADIAARTLVRSAEGGMRF